MILTYFLTSQPTRTLWLSLAAFTIVGCNPLRQTESCGGQVQQVLPGPGGRKVQVIETTCHGTDEVQIFVVEKRGSTKILAFAYDRMGPSPDFARQDVGPTVVWVGPNSVKISIDMIAYIRKKRSVAGKTRIEYDIGKVLYPEDNSGTTKRNELISRGGEKPGS